MKCLQLTLCLSILVAALPAQAEVFKCIVNGKTEYRSAATAPPGCESHEVKAIPYDPKEAERVKERLKQMEARDEAKKAEEARRREELTKQAERQQEQRNAEDRARARAAAEAREMQRLRDAIGY